MSLDLYLELALQKGASDLHLASGQPVMVRLEGQMRPLQDNEPLAPHRVERVLYDAMDDRARESVQQQCAAEFMHTLTLATGEYHFRASLFRDRQGLNGVFRRIAEVPPSLEELGMPGRLLDMVNARQGLVLVTGPSGSGKTTTLAALVHHLNMTRAGHVVTLEDPVEYVHHSHRCLISQREIGRDTRSFAAGLRAALREAPDVILVGELRDLESTSLAVTAAETGHLVLATAHTHSAPSTVERIVFAFPAEQQSQVRTMLSESLRGVVTQRLLPRADGRGRVPAVEIMVGTPAIANLIREGRTFQIAGIIETGAYAGMQSFNQSLEQLVAANVITPQVARRYAQGRVHFE